jgi:hypothetical protein
MYAILNSHNATEMNDAELELVSGGAFLTPVKSEAQQAAEQLSAIYKANHPYEFGPFAPPHTAVPRF